MIRKILVPIIALAFMASGMSPAIVGMPKIDPSLQTNKEIPFVIAMKKVPKFKPGKKLKGAAG